MHVLEERLADAALIMEWWSATYLKAALGRYIILPFIKIFCRRSQESRVYQSSVVNILQSGEEQNILIYHILFVTPLGASNVTQALPLRIPPKELRDFHNLSTLF